MESEMAAMPPWKKVESPMKTTCLFLMNASMPAPAAPPSAIAERVVHQARKRLVFQHRIAADIAVKNQIYRGRVMLFFHVIGIHELLRDLEEDAG